MRKFLGWDSSVVSSVVEHIVGNLDVSPGEPVDLDGLIIVVPTRHAGRRLREALACWCNKRGTSLLSAMVVTPHYFFGPDFLPANIAGPAVVRMIWVDILMNADFSGFGALFPGMAGERSFQWALNVAELLENLRQELADAALTIDMVVKEKASLLEEMDRWEALNNLERMYLKRLEDEGLIDGCSAKIMCASSVAGAIEADRVIVAAVPDPSLLAIEALKRISERVNVEILVHATEERADDFDDWGRPEPAGWIDSTVDIPDFSRNVFLEASSAEQSRRVLKEMRRSCKEFESGEIAIGVPDRSVVPFLEKDLGNEDLLVFDPADVVVTRHSIGRLAQALLGCIRTGSYEDVALLMRHPDIVEFLDKKHEFEIRDVLDQLDQFQNYYLPVTLEQMLKPFQANARGTNEWRDDFTELGKALKVVNDLLGIFEEKGFEDAWREFFRMIYSVRTIDRSKLRDIRFEKAAMAVDSVLCGFRELEGRRHGMDMSQLSAIFVSQLGCVTFHNDRRDEVVDLEGWLELPWNDRPFLLVTGLNDNFVPGGSLSDAFLPDSLRGRLGMRDDKARLARDIFLFAGMIASRRKSGRTCFIIGKTGGAGDHLRPSRLLFRCPDGELPNRVEKLFAPVEDAEPRPSSKVIFPLRPGVVAPKNDIRQTKHISATMFRDYLQCPFRFYLRHVLGMEECDDRKTGLDHMDFGNIVHDVLKIMGQDRDLWGCRDAGRLAEHLAGLAEKYVHARFGAPLSLSVHISLMSAIQRLSSLAKVQVAQVMEGWEVIEAESSDDPVTHVRRRLERNGFVISGRIDRVDCNKRTGAIRIIDYKTSDSAQDPADKHLKRRKDDAPAWNKFQVPGNKSLKQWIDLQLPIYAMIYAAGGGGVSGGVQLAYFNLPKAVSRTGIYVWEGFDADMLKSAEDCVDGVLRAIGGGVFWPPSDSVANDEFGDLFNHESCAGVDAGGLTV